MRHVLEVLEDDTKSVYETATRKTIEKLIRAESDDLFAYKPLFEDLINLVSFVNDNNSLKMIYLKKLRQNIGTSSSKHLTLNDTTIKVAEYMQQF